MPNFPVQCEELGAFWSSNLKDCQSIHAQCGGNMPCVIRMAPHFLSTSRLDGTDSYSKVCNICTRVVLNRCSCLMQLSFMWVMTTLHKWVAIGSIEYVCIFLVWHSGLLMPNFQCNMWRYGLWIFQIGRPSKQFIPTVLWQYAMCEEFVKSWSTPFLVPIKIRRNEF